MSLPKNDKAILRELGERIAEIGNLPVQKEKADLWRQLNSLKRTRPLVWINEEPWEELNVNGELTPRCENKFLRSIERLLRQKLYKWDHFRGDMVVDPVVHSPLAFSETGWGIQSRTVHSDTTGGSADFEPVIKSEEDVEKIQTPKVTLDEEATKKRYQMLCEVFEGILPVEKIGISTLWFAPWDFLVQYYGITELYMDMMDKPDLVNKAISRTVDAMLGRLEQFEALGILTVTNNNHRVGSGGLGITDELPQKDYDGVHARTMDQWGTSTGQIFSEVSPEMHYEFCLRHELRWLEKFGLNCYGCCEPVHNKMDLMRKIPRLRRISMSPWVNVEKAAEQCGMDFVFSSKPNPALLATEKWNPELVKKDLRRVLDATKGCPVELILKDVSTVRNEPQRLWEWATVAMEVAQEYA